MSTPVYGSEEYAILLQSMIVNGRIDPYLRHIYNAVIERKKELEATQSLPVQKSMPRMAQDRQADALAPWELELLGAGVAAPSAASTATAVMSPPASAPAISRKPRRYTRKTREVLTDRPDSTMAQTALHSIHPVKTSPVDPDKHLLLDGNFYERSDVIGSCLQVGSMYGLPDLRVKVIGVGPKAVKAVIVNAPPSGIMHGNGSRKIDLYDSWLNNNPVYFQHSILSPVLAHY